MRVTTVDVEMVCFIADQSRFVGVRSWWGRVVPVILHASELLNISEVRKLALKALGAEPELLQMWLDFLAEHPNI